MFALFWAIKNLVLMQQFTQLFNSNISNSVAVQNHTEVALKVYSTQSIKHLQLM